jgi:hypothetical protein
MCLFTGMRQRLRTLFVCVVLEFGTLIGVPMRPEEIEELLHTMNGPKIAHRITDESDARRDQRHGSVQP